ncbi:hypothetical protein PYJP_04030 [Pyrofollis japonicus]|uniref:ribbon-helix-helix domain-containing protein n=1 Tax=Pyrofollis japonicus TaxID=3060460 RepID=UPI00295B84EB|nr:ribbon-helix-helix domain-containing protein [Pyrofollis japonicus]BEP17051.1 hypothetical protein PYJP_04030 [Pyrofollis japonicus]
MLDSVTFKILAYIALKRMDIDPLTNCFEFSKAEFTRAYKKLLRHRLVGFRKYETLFRNLRKYAEAGKLVKYVDREKGIYKTCISSLELDKRWPSVLEELRGLETTEWLSIELDDSTAARLEKIAAEQGKRLPDIVRDALRLYIDFLEGKHRIKEPAKR